MGSLKCLLSFENRKVGMNKFKTINIVEPELVSLMREAAELGAASALVNVGKLNEYVSKNEAYKRVGNRRKVEEWIRSGVLKVSTAGVNLKELLAIAASANLATYVHAKQIRR